MLSSIENHVAAVVSINEENYVDIAIGSDHGGFNLKSALIAYVRQLGHVPVDVGVYDDQPSDYPDSARAVANAVLDGSAERGILICGSGVGACVAANKFPGIRAAVCHDTFSARQGVEDDDMNVVCLGARVVGPALAGEIIKAFLAATFSRAERHVRRLNKVKEIENEYMKETS
jgi:ribose 5-phosphate isomerase B